MWVFVGTVRDCLKGFVNSQPFQTVPKGPYKNPHGPYTVPNGPYKKPRTDHWSVLVLSKNKFVFGWYLEPVTISNQRIISSYLFLFCPRLCRGLYDPEACSRPASSRPASFSGALLVAAAVAACLELHSCRDMDFVWLSQQTWPYLSPPHRAAAYWTTFAHKNQRKIEGPCRSFGFL